MSDAKFDEGVGRGKTAWQSGHGRCDIADREDSTVHHPHSLYTEGN